MTKNQRFAQFPENDTTLFSALECEKVARLDADLVSSDARYVSANLPTYQLLINTWLWQISDTSLRARLEVKDALLKMGLIPIIKECDACANRVLHGEDGCFPSYLITATSGISSLSRLLQLLRYPKRFSPAFADKIQAAGMEKFLAINERCLAHRNDFMSETGARRCARELKKYIARMLRGGFKVDYVRDAKFGNGTCSDSAPDLGHKIEAFSLYQGYIHSLSYSISNVPTLAPKRCYQGTHDMILAKVASVPKSYKTSRIIAMESAYHSFHAQAIREALVRKIRSNGEDQWVDVEDQKPNQQLCFESAISKNMATVDISSASDSINRTLAWQILPHDVLIELDQWIPTHMNVICNGREQIRSIHMLCTSGDACTFILESIIFLAICRYATDMAQVWFDQKLECPRVYGDDCIIDCRAFDTFVSICELLTIDVNIEKSFSDEASFRESCGSEYFDGLNTVSQYFPRKTMDWSKPASCLASVTSLQHKLYSNWYAQHYLAKCARAIDPRMTSSAPGTDCQDLWEDIPQCRAVRRRGSTGDDEAFFLEGHLSPVARYDGSLLNTRSKKNGLSYAEMLEVWIYQTWLQRGPQYEDPLSRLLQVSEKPVDRKSLISQAEMIWR